MHIPDFYSELPLQLGRVLSGPEGAAVAGDDAG